MHFPTLSTIATLAATLTPMASASRATFYGGNLSGGQCSFSTYTLPDGVYGTALSSQNWDDSANCGACMRVNRGGKSVTAMVVDLCPECPRDGVDLFENAFVELGTRQEGVIDVDWEWVDCPVEGGLGVRMKEGSSAYWFAGQILNAEKPVDDLQVSTDGGKTWQGGLERKEYNFFQKASGFGTSSVAVKAISEDGEEVVISDVQVQGGSEAKARENFTG